MHIFNPAPIPCKWLPPLTNLTTFGVSYGNSEHSIDFLFLLALSYSCVNGIGNGLGMHFSGKMNRALAVNGIPSCRIGRTEELGFDAHFSGCIINRSTDNTLTGFP